MLSISLRKNVLLTALLTGAVVLSGSLMAASNATAESYVFSLQWGSEGTSDGQFNDPTGAAVDGQGNVYVVDSINQRIQKFTADGDFITKWGRLGSDDGEFGYPEGVAVDGQGNVYVADSGNDRIQVFALDSDSDGILDSDSDGIADEEDNCPTKKNASQSDTDGDGKGDACEGRRGFEFTAGEMPSLPSSTPVGSTGSGENGKPTAVSSSSAKSTKSGKRAKPRKNKRSRRGSHRRPRK